VGVIVTEEYVCDYCTKRIPDTDVLVGRLSLRKQAPGASDWRWDSRCNPAMLGQVHCQGNRRRRTRRSSSAAQAVAEPELPPEPQAPPPRRRRVKSST